MALKGSLLLLLMSMVLCATGQMPSGYEGLAEIAEFGDHWSLCVTELSDQAGVSESSTNLQGTYLLFNGSLTPTKPFASTPLPTDGWMEERYNLHSWAEYGSDCSGPTGNSASYGNLTSPITIFRYVNLTQIPELIETGLNRTNVLIVTIHANTMKKTLPTILISASFYGQDTREAVDSNSAVIYPSEWSDGAYSFEMVLDLEAHIRLISIHLSSFEYAENACLTSVDAIINSYASELPYYATVLNIIEYILFLLVIIVPLAITFVAPHCRPVAMHGYDMLLDRRTSTSRWVVLLMYALLAQLVFHIVMDVTSNLFFSTEQQGTNFLDFSLINLSFLAGQWTQHISQSAPNLLPVVRFIVSIFRMMVASLVYWPLFLSYSNRHRIVGCVCGMATAATLFLYRLMLLTLEQLFFTKDYEAKQTLFLTLPELIGLPLLVLYFIFRLGVILKSMYQRRFGSGSYVQVTLDSEGVDPRMVKHLLHVREVLKGKPNVHGVTIRKQKARTWKDLLSLVYWIDVWHQMRHTMSVIWFPQRISVSVAIVMSLIWAFGISIYFSLLTVVPVVSCSLSTAGIILPAAVGFLNDTSSILDVDFTYETLLNNAIEVDGVVQRVIVWSIALAIFGSLAHLLFLMRASLYDLDLIRKGDYQRIPWGKKHILFMHHALVYVGFQAGFSFIGFFISCSFLLTVLTIATILQYTPVLRMLAWSYLMQNWFFASVLIIVMFWLLQSLLTWFVFTYGKERGGFWIKWRATFLQYDYFTTYVNIIQGVFTFVFRLLVSFVFTILFCYRLDMSTLGEFGSTFFDAGHLAYLAVILSEHHYMNPVVLVFFHHLDYHVLLPPSIEESRKHHQKEDQENGLQPNQSKVRRQYRNKMWLLITLTNNPDIIPLRKHRLQSHTQLESISTDTDLISSSAIRMQIINEHPQESDDDIELKN